MDYIYLRPVARGHEVWHIATNDVITRRGLTPAPITPSIIKQVAAIAEAEGMPKGLKIETRSGQVLFDSSLIAGVDYDEEDFDDDEVEGYDEVDEEEVADIVQDAARHEEAANEEEPSDDESTNDKKMKIMKKTQKKSK